MSDRRLMMWSGQWRGPAVARSRADFAGEAGVLAVAAAVGWLCDRYPTHMPAWAPWDFSWPDFLGIGFGLLWFARGLRRTPVADRPSFARTTCFLLGMAATYAVLLSRFEYLTQHMFFLNRVQHLVLHHLAPFLIAWSWPGAVIARGMPPAVRRCCGTAPVRRVLRWLQRPLLAGLLFEGLLILWLVPPVTFRAMLDWRLYAVMNASMLVDGLLFWCLVLDPRPSPPAPTGFFARLSLAFVIIFPQIGAGTIIASAQHDLYPSFALCGRVFPAIGPLLDQQIGGLILWVPAGMMSALAAVVIMRRMFLHDDRLARSAAGFPRSEGVA
jgi:putative membrane protein